jgi:hypothetical protein
MINSISVANKLDPYKSTNKISRNLPVNAYSGFLAIKQNRVSFAGSSPIFTGFANNFRKFLTPVKRTLLKQVDGTSELQTNKLIKSLEEKEHGAYFLANGEYIYSTEPLKNSKEAIIKLGLKKAEVQFQIKKSNLYNVGLQGYREDFTPSRVLYFLEYGFEKVTMIVDNGIQTLTLPKKAKHRKSAFKALKNHKALKLESFTIYYLPEKRPEQLFEWAKEMIENIPDIKLELIPPQK